MDEFYFCMHTGFGARQGPRLTETVLSGFSVDSAKSGFDIHIKEAHFLPLKLGKRPAIRAATPTAPPPSTANFSSSTIIYHFINHPFQTEESVNSNFIHSQCVSNSGIYWYEDSFVFLQSFHHAARFMFDSNGDSCEKGSTSAWDQHCIHVRKLVYDLNANGAIAFYYVWVVKTKKIIILAPSRSARVLLKMEALNGMTTLHGIPSLEQFKAMAMPLLPELDVMTPSFFCSSLSNTRAFMSEERDLIKKRGSFKGRLTAFVTFLDSLKDKVLSSCDVSELQLRMGKMESLYEQYDEVQLRLECIADDIKVHNSERTEFESLYYKALSRAQTTLNDRLIDQLNKDLRALESLGEPVKHWGTFLIYHVTQKIDHRTYREWEEFKGRIDKESSITFDMFMQFLRTRADLIENLERLRTNNNSQTAGRSNPRIKSMLANQSNNSSSIETAPQVCPKCHSNDHTLNNCPQFLALSIDARIKLLPTYKICFNCLRSGHFANKCKKAGCKLCKRRHNTLIHVDSKNNIIANTHSGNSSNNNLSSSSVPSATTDANNVTLSAHIASSQGHTQRDVLLSTALIKLRDHTGCVHVVRSVLDSGSTSSFITERLCKKLNLFTSQEDNLPPLKWRLGRVVAVHLGTDGIACVADIQTATGIVREAFN
ncbi:hypothetical protein HW555_006902 [Spodoptera exigua]|uniref:CCHC-type domain-containing protein n=1 Tax=Spodoptera exigua TaxID=7107 RepID=A0A835GHV0_SPOEX|nr:hypothetical protein HW555_006902 [Spodoptera exigua]